VSFFNFFFPQAVVTNIIRQHVVVIIPIAQGLLFIVTNKLNSMQHIFKTRNSQNTHLATQAM
jgi:hypothetical protein